MDRASDSGSEGWGFESLPVYQIKKRIPARGILFFISRFAREGIQEDTHFVLLSVAEQSGVESKDPFSFIDG